MYVHIFECDTTMSKEIKTIKQTEAGHTLTDLSVKKRSSYTSRILLSLLYVTAKGKELKILYELYISLYKGDATKHVMQFLYSK